MTETPTRPRVLPTVHRIGWTRTGTVRHIVDRTSDEMNPRGAENTMAHCGREVTVTDTAWSGGEPAPDAPECERCRGTAYLVRMGRARRQQRYVVIERPVAVVYAVVDKETGETLTDSTKGIAVHQCAAMLNNGDLAPEDVRSSPIPCPGCEDPDGPCDESCEDPGCERPWDCCRHDACETPGRQAAERRCRGCGTPSAECDARYEATADSTGELCCDACEVGDTSEMHAPVAVTMWACVTVQDTAAAETAVCGEHRDGFVPTPGWVDVEDLTLQDCTGNESLSCTVCGARADAAE